MALVKVASPCGDFSCLGALVHRCRAADYVPTRHVAQALDSRPHNTLILSLFVGKNFLRTSFLGLATGQIEIGDVIYFFPS